MRISEMTPLELREWRIKELTKKWGPDCFHPQCDVNGGKFASKADITFDHWIPQSRGGTWDIDNLRLMHKRCNALKSDTMPNSDGTLPPRVKALNAFERKRARAQVRVDICAKCNSGRLLGPEEFCDVCGSTAMPFSHPQWSKMKPQDCDHAGIWWCWACMSGIIEREPAIASVLDGKDSDLD